jgi:hypothetical protein
VRELIILDDQTLPEHQNPNADLRDWGRPLSKNSAQGPPVPFRPNSAIAEPAANVSDGSIVLKKSNFPVDHNLNARRQALGEFR